MVGNIMSGHVTLEVPQFRHILRTTGTAKRRTVEERSPMYFLDK